MLGRRKLKMRRYLKGSRDGRGSWNKNTPSMGHIVASVQPLSGNELQALPEGRRETESYVLFSNNEMKTVLENDTPDEVEIRNQWYEVFSRKNWENNIINHIEYVVQRVTTK